MNTAQMTQQILTAHNVAVPLVGISCADPAATIEALATALLAEADEGRAVPVVQWDIASGFRVPPSLPERAAASAQRLLEQAIQKPGAVTNPVEAMQRCLALPGRTDATEGTVVFVINAHRFMENPNIPGTAAFVQAVWNLRDAFKVDQRMLVLLGPQITLPPELVQDVVMFTEDLPGDEALAAVVTRQFDNAELPVPEPTVLTQAVWAVRGLSAGASENATAMSLTLKGLDFDRLWQRKIQALESVKGLTVYKGTETFDQIGGLWQIKAFATGICSGPARPRIVITMEEGEKMMSAAFTGGDNTGVSSDQFGVMLSAMEDYKWPGILAIGVPGAGKSLLAKALANSAYSPTLGPILSIRLDLGAMKSGLLGSSEAAIRNFVRMLYGVAGKGGALFVANINKPDIIPPEWLRRFRLGKWFFDIPTREEKDSIWPVCLKEFNLLAPDGSTPALPEDEGWTGSDIYNVCDIAWRLRVTLDVARTFIVPITKSDPQRLAEMRETADGHFLSATYPGTYQRPTEEGPVKRRNISLAKKEGGSR